MCRVGARAWPLVLLLAVPAVLADVLLDGNQHIGNNDTKGDASALFTPTDPVGQVQHQSYPTNFHLSQATTVTAVRLNGAIGLDGDIDVFINGTNRTIAAVCTACSSCTGRGPACGDFDLTLDSPLTLGAGFHTIAIDPKSPGNDIGFSGLTLISTQTSTSVNLNQRRQIGDDNDTDDDYDITDPNSPWYPDDTGGAFVDISFTLNDNRRLSEVKFYRLRDLDISTAQVLVNGTFIGNLANTGDPLEADPTTISTNFLLASGAHTLRVQTANIVAGNLDTFSWDGIILRFTDVTSAGTPGFFNAVDAGANLLSGSLTTKVAGGAYTLDLYALNGFGTGLLSTYNGGASVELMNASNSSGAQDQYGCSSTWSVAQALPSVTFVGGYAPVSGTFLDAGLREARIRVTDSATGARGCSIDNFAVRPASFGVVPSHDSETTAGITTALTNTATSGLPRHRAGQPFTIVASALGAGAAAATNYDGTPDVTAQAIAPATTSGTVTIDSWGAASGGARRTDTAKYSEVGAVTLQLQDTGYASVDADDSTTAQRYITGSADAGRYTPDHFSLTEGQLAPACALGGFSYLGSTLGWSSAAVTLTAANASNGTTLNYAGLLDKLPDDLAQAAYAAYDNPALSGSPVLITAGLAVPDVTDAAAGIATITLPGLSFVRGLIAAFNAEIAITLPVFTDDDGIAPAESPIVIGSATAGGGVAFTGNANSQRFGRLYFEPRYGSERLPLGVPLRAEYFDGVAFLPNTADVCTILVTGDVTLAALGGQVHAVTANGNGRWTVTLSAPNVPGQAGLGVDLASPGATVPYPLLQADANADGTYAEDPAATVTFGIHSQEDRRIYQREVVGN